jgi:hypothetical protein
MTTNISNMKDYSVYPGEYIPIPEEEASVKIFNVNIREKYWHTKN